jgi:hypothetical protein
MKSVVNFSAGEASPEIKGRVDVTPYYSMAETLENVLVTHFGGFLRTPGTKFVARTKDMSKDSRLIPFVFSQGDASVLEFGDEYIRFFTENGSLVETGLDISDVSNADPCVITSNVHGLTDGDAVDISGIVGTTELNGKRFLVANKTSNTFEITDEDGNDIDSTNFGVYSSGGKVYRVYEIVSPYDSTDLEDLKFTQQADIVYITHPDYAPRKLSRLGATSWTIAEIAFDTFSWPPFLPINTTATTLACSHTTGTGRTLTASASLFTTDHVGAYFRLDHTTNNGYVRITAVTNATTATCTVVSALNATTATADWFEGAWSAVQGYPKDCKFYEQRLYFVSTAKKPLTTWGSEVESYENFKVGTEDSDPVSFTVGSSQVDSILWLYPSSALTLGTAGGPFIMSSGSSVEAITPSTIFAKQQNENGVSSVSPVRIGPFVYYVERSGRLIGQFSYSLDYDAFETENITYFSDHILGDGVKYMALQKYPYNILWCVREDGVVATMTREIKNEVKGWTRQVFAGTDVKVESVTSIPNGIEDQVWFIVLRTINSVTTRYIEYVKEHDFGDLEDAFFVQSGLTFSGTATDTVSGLEHLEGEEVQILIDGAVHPNRTVEDGAIELDWEGTKITVGLGYKSTVKTMDLEKGDGSAGKGQVKSISMVTVRLYKSLGCTIGDGITQDIIPFRSWGDNFDEAVPLFTGDKEVQFPSGHDKNKYIVIEQEQPLPLRVLGLYPKGIISGG